MRSIPAIICAVSLALLVVLPVGVYAQSGSLHDMVAMINDDTPDAPDVIHNIAFTLPDSALSINPTDYIHLTFTDFANLTIPTGISGTYAGTPSYSVSGVTVKITGITVIPNRRITINGITAQNPSNSGSRLISIAVTEDEAGLLVKNFGTVLASVNPLTVAISADVEYPHARIQISGFTQPSTFIFFSAGETIIGTDLAAPLGTFSKLFSALEPGTHRINLYGVDTASRTTSIVPLNISAPAYQTTTISNLLLSPTISIHANTILQGDPIHATGSAYPGTEITLMTDTPLRTYTASASASGNWTTSITDTASYNVGDYRLYALATTIGGLQSLKSPTHLFTIVSPGGGGGGSACGDIGNGDLNCDDIVNLTDFSILMYYWGTNDATADINTDGVVDLTDFSIMMYYWGT